MLGGAAEELGGDAVAQLDQRAGDLRLHQVPVGLFRMALEFGPHGAGPLANAGGLGPQLGIGDHFFHIAEPIGPFAEIARP